MNSYALPFPNGKELHLMISDINTAEFALGIKWQVHDSVVLRRKNIVFAANLRRKLYICTAKLF